MNDFWGYSFWVLHGVLHGVGLRILSSPSTGGVLGAFEVSMAMEDFGNVEISMFTNVSNRLYIMCEVLKIF